MRKFLLRSVAFAFCLGGIVLLGPVGTPYSYESGQYYAWNRDHRPPPPPPAHGKPPPHRFDKDRPGHWDNGRRPPKFDKDRPGHWDNGRRPPKFDKDHRPPPPPGHPPNRPQPR